MTTYNEIGKTTVSSEVLNKIARLTTLSVKGVSRMSSCRDGLAHLLTSEECKGVKVQVKDGLVFVEIYVILISDMNVRDISRDIQARVSRAIAEMIGLDVGGVNVHIMDIDFKA